MNHELFFKPSSIILMKENINKISTIFGFMDCLLQCDFKYIKKALHY